MATPFCSTTPLLDHVAQVLYALADLLHALADLLEALLISGGLVQGQFSKLVFGAWV